MRSIVIEVSTLAARRTQRVEFPFPPSYRHKGRTLNINRILSPTVFPKESQLWMELCTSAPLPTFCPILAEERWGCRQDHPIWENGKEIKTTVISSSWTEQRTCPKAVILKLSSGAEPCRAQSLHGLALSHGPQGALSRKYWCQRQQQNQ